METEHIILDCERFEARRKALLGCQQSGDEYAVSIGKKLQDLVKGMDIGLPS